MISDSDESDVEVVMPLKSKEGKKWMWIDVEDKNWAEKINWYENKQGYAKWTCRQKGKDIYLHHEIIKRKLQLDEIPKAMQVDHIDGNRLNNTRSNLRLCTPQQNAQNRKRHRNNTSGQKGVYFNKQKRKWSAYISENGKKKVLGRYHTLEEAAEVRKLAEEELFGEFMRK